MFSPFLKRPFEQAIKDGLLPPTLSTLAGTWGAIHETGELTYMNLVHMDGDRRHRPRRSDPRRDRGPPPGDARRSRRCAGTRLVVSGARLRNFGMTLGIRDTRKIDAVYNMTEHDVRDQGTVRRRDRDLSRVHRRLRHLDPADDRSLLPAPVPQPRAEGRAQPSGRRPLVGWGPSVARLDA